MTRTVDVFWDRVFLWKRNQSPIRIECHEQLIERSFLGSVSEINGSAVTFRDAKTADEIPMDFRKAEIRLHSFDPTGAVMAFAAMWEDEPGPHSIIYTFTELRSFSEPN